MKKVIFISHGELAKGALNTLSMFCDTSQNYTAICGYVNDCNPETELKKFFQKTVPEDLVIIFTDIIGGSVNNLAIPYLSRPNTWIFSGFNLAMILSLISLTENPSEEEIRELASIGQEAVVCMNDYVFDTFCEEDE